MVSLLKRMDNKEIIDRLERRLGRMHARQRLGIEDDHDAHVFGHGLNFFHIENWYSIHSLIRNTLKISGLYWRGRNNCKRIELRHNYIKLSDLPAEFDGFTILHISDMHVDMNPEVMTRLIELLQEIDYDICVLTGDYRGKTFGSFDETLEGMARVQAHIKKQTLGVLGNHDTIRMLPGLEDMGITMLLNESTTIQRGDARLHFAGVDDAHYFRADNIEKAAAKIPHNEFSIMLSHTPEIYRQAAYADFNVLLGGHTHGGQICLPGKIPLTLDADLPRALGSGAWKYHNMVGYTSVGVGASVVAVRLNCPPEITLHHLSHNTL
ncbi:MAG: metallophosphoesterase family protein [Gammaproteobacteria bacterium]|nr:metallophosphoesterase family protein [Gammaproteobacteria bacterium]